jgi:hypothetical protein
MRCAEAAGVARHPTMSIATTSLLLAALGMATLLGGFAARATKVGPYVMGAGIVLLLSAVVHHVIGTLG